jgi:hypothetical protein
MGEKNQRNARLLDRKPGSWGTTSGMYFDALRGVFRESRKASAGDPMKPSRWVYAGIPLLITGVDAFLIEHQHLLRDNFGTQLVAGIADIRTVLGRLYLLPDELRLDIEALVEVRNQIVHPSPVPFGIPEWPASLQRLRERKVLGGDIPQSGTDVLSLLANHNLFEWAVVTCAKTLEIVAASDEREELFRGLVRNLWRVLAEEPSLDGL